MKDTYESRVAEALAFAYVAHEGQVYRGYGGRPDEPYVLHPIRVALSLPPLFRVVALLHDCKEDAGVLPEWLSEEELSALDLLTRDKAAKLYAEYIDALLDASGRAGHVARLVKLADLRDNLSHDPPQRLRDRYTTALDRLVSSGVGS